MGGGLGLQTHAVQLELGKTAASLSYQKQASQVHAFQ